MGDTTEDDGLNHLRDAATRKFEQNQAMTSEESAALAGPEIALGHADGDGKIMELTGLTVDHILEMRLEIAALLYAAEVGRIGEEDGPSTDAFLRWADDLIVEHLTSSRRFLERLRREVRDAS